MVGMPGSVEQHFMNELQRGIKQLKTEIGYNPTYFIRMVAELGPVGASCHLIRSTAPSDGFTKLWEHGMLDMTVEALALLPWYAPLFEESDRQLAQDRLRNYKFDIETFLGRRTAVPPQWYRVASGD
jgi:hypothetical protein